MFKLKLDSKYGVILRIDCDNLADELDDFLAENYYIFYEQRHNNEAVEFIFGFASSVERVNMLLEAFTLKK